MVQFSGKGAINGAAIACSLPFLALVAVTLAVFLGFVITPWLGLPLGPTIQSYIWNVNDGDPGKNAEVNLDGVGQSVDFVKNNTLPAHSYEANEKKKIVNGSEQNNGGHSIHSAPEPKHQDYNGGVDQKSQQGFTNISSQTADQQIQSNGTGAPFVDSGDAQKKSVSTTQMSKDGHDPKEMASPPPISNPALASTEKCDLFNGQWVHDSPGPLYKNDSCPILTQQQNCQGNGRPDKDYENWRWKPMNCDLPRFDARKFLEIMHGKTLAFVGDSVARNQMESMMCILWQVETPQNKGNRKMQRWFFPSHSVTIIRIWSSWLVHTSSEAFEFAPEGLTKLHLDKTDETFMDYIHQFDVLVISSGHWFAKKAAFVLNNNIVGGQLWWEKGHDRKIESPEAFAIATETALKGLVNHPNYKGITILRSYSPDHYEGGAWNTGGSCTGKVKPFTEKEIVPNGFTDLMWSRQVHGYEEARKSVNNKSKLILMDITKVFQYRGDGHPGPYRSPDPNKITKRGRNGRPPPQDCLHWCMPGPVDIWNEFVFEIVRRNLNWNEA